MFLSFFGSKKNNLFSKTERKFPGFVKAEDPEDKDSYEPKIHKEKIFGVHIDNYMKELKKGSGYERQFSIWDK